MNLLNDDYNVDNYSDKELFEIMDLVNPTDRELEAKIYMLIEKYENIDKSLYDFFQTVFKHFFDEEGNTEGFENSSKPPSPPLPLPLPSPISISDAPIVTTTNKTYTKDKLNPLLKETIKRIVSIDSQFRDKTIHPYSTDFAFNLSDTITDVVSLKLYSIQIPYTWYTISNEFGSNFFYLKGNSPGINQGYYDYQIIIQSGNYTASDFEGKINESFLHNVILPNTDVNFGTSGVKFNTVNAKLTTTVDITSVYNETNYELIFPPFDSYNINTHIVSSIPQLLGYNETNYRPNSIYSNIIDSTIINKLYTIDSTNNTIQIFLYQGILSNFNISNYSYSSNNTIISIVSTLIGSHSFGDIIKDFNNEILKNDIFIKPFSSISIVGNRLKLSIFFNRKKLTNATNGKNMKSVVIFPPNDLWSIFNSLYNELSNVISEAPSKITSYNIPLPLSIELHCNNSNYNNPTNLNNKTISILPSIGLYNSKDYFAAINNGMNILSISTGNAFNCHIDINNDYKPIITCTISNIIPFKTNNVNNFNLDITGSILHNICGFTPLIVDSITTSSFKIRANGYSMSTGENKFTINSIGIRNNYVPSVVITIIQPVGNVFLYLENLFDAINKSFATINPDNVDCSKTYITYNVTDDGIVHCTLNVNIETVLTHNDYTLKLIDPNSNNNSWYTFLNFDFPSYNMANGLIAINSNPDNKIISLYSQIISANSFYSNELILTDTNNFISIKAILNENGGVYVYGDDNGYYDTKLTLTLPIGQSYTKEVIVSNMNIILQNNYYTLGSFIDITNSNTIIRVNVNKIFTAQDYRIVFYDSTFVHCSYGLSSIENVKLDTTLGWILGYRNLTEYILSINNVSTVTANNITLSYYTNYTTQVYTLNAITNIATITGDTSINVNLYNYVMLVVDDYCQNHLNDGLVTITKADYNIPLPSYGNRSTYKCDPITGNYSVSNTPPVNNNNLTIKQIYSANEILNTQQTKHKENKFSPGPFVQDIFGLVPMKLNGLSPGQTFVEFGGTLQNQERIYFGPVNIRKMSIQLLNDKGSLLDLNGANFSFSFLVEQLYTNPSK
jgi:hypothetical protein